METTTSLPGSPSESNDDSDRAVLVLIGFPGCGKSETGNTLIGQRYFKNALQMSGSNKTQEAKSVFGDLHVTVRDMPGFESLSEFVRIYNSLTDLECRKVVFGFTIEIGRFPTEYNDTLKSLFKEDGIGEHLKRKTFLIFTNVDKLLKYNEVSYEDYFEKWLRDAEGIDQLITSLKLGYCVIQNKQSGDKQTQQANQVIQQLKCVLQNGNEQETWYRRDENKIANRSDVRSLIDDSKTPEDSNCENLVYNQVMDTKFTTTLRQVFSDLKKLQKTNKHSEMSDIIDQMLSNYKIKTMSGNTRIAERLLRECIEQPESKLEIVVQKSSRKCIIL